MHVPDGFINAQVSTATGVISLGTLWVYIRSAKNLVADKLIALTGRSSCYCPWSKSWCNMYFYCGRYTISPIC